MYSHTALRFLAFLTALALLCGILFSLSYSLTPQIPQPTLQSERIMTVVIDAGHGGEDGGAVAKNGAYEKDINLRIALLLKDLLRANGIKVIMTRETDVLLYDKNTDYRGRKKMLDLAARRKIAEETENCIFISIHMNTHPIESCQGLQVWYSPNTPSSLKLAKCIQDTTREVLQPENKRSVKVGNSSIYLLHKLCVPAVLVECGFVSNAEEAALLCTDTYQRKLALTLFLSIMKTDFSEKEN